MARARTVGIWPEREVPAELRHQVLAIRDDTWPDLGDKHHDPALDPVTMLLLEGDVVVAALDVLSKPIEHAGETFAASGLSTVITATDRRRRGHGAELVRAARAKIENEGADLGIFTCDTPLRGFYERCGWEVIPGAVLVGGTREDPFPSDRFDKVVLASFFTDHGRRHASTFQGARIELYPGKIDMLW